MALSSKMQSVKTVWLSLDRPNYAKCYYVSTSVTIMFVFVNLHGVLQGVFAVNTHQGRQLLLRAPTDEDRKVWAHAIGGVIRALEGVALTESSDAVKKLSNKVNLR